MVGGLSGDARGMYSEAGRIHCSSVVGNVCMVMAVQHPSPCSSLVSCDRLLQELAGSPGSVWFAAPCLLVSLQHLVHQPW